MKVIIAGSRSIVDYIHIEDAARLSNFDITEIVSGTARGVDQLGEQLATKHNTPVAKFPADWNNTTVPGAVIKHNQYGAYNAIAGHMRNAQMAQYADALIAVWDGKSRGTTDMITRMRKLKKRVFVHTVKQ